jgi:hypothetical protein
MPTKLEGEEGDRRMNSYGDDDADANAGAPTTTNA